MKKLLIFIISFWTVNTSLFAADQYIPPTNKNIEYVGRWDKSNPEVYHSYWGGAYFKVRFIGSQVTLKLGSPVNIYVKIDDGQEVLYTKASGLIKITPDSLSHGIHHLSVIAKFQDDEIQLTGLYLNKKGRLLKPEKKNFWVEFIGDSITSGDRTSKGNTSAYPWLCGEDLEVKHTQISYCGIPLVDGYHYNYKGAPKIGMESAYFELKEPNSPEPNSSYIFKNVAPNLIVINLGTNDKSLTVPSNLFQSHYALFIQGIRERLPKVRIALLIPFNGSYQNEIRNMVHESFPSDQNLKIIETKDWLAKGDFVDGTHPTDEGHQKIAKQLSPIILTYLQ
jgi:hypothetical protein